MLKEQSDLGPHCLHTSFLSETLVYEILGHLPYVLGWRERETDRERERDRQTNRQRETDREIQKEKTKRQRESSNVIAQRIETDRTEQTLKTQIRCYRMWLLIRVYYRMWIPSGVYTVCHSTNNI